MSTVEGAGECGREIQSGVSLRSMTVKLSIQKKAKVLDENQKSTSIAGVVYGPKFPSTAVVVDRKEFEKTYKEVGESTIVELVGLDSVVEVLIKEVDFSPLKSQIVHVDFYVLEAGKDISTAVPLHFVGEAPVTKTGAVINKVMHEVKITCKPSQLPAHLEVDLSLLNLPEDKICISDLVLPKGVKVQEAETEVIAIAETVEEEMSETKVVTESVAVTAPETV